MKREKVFCVILLSILVSSMAGTLTPVLGQTNVQTPCGKYIHVNADIASKIKSLGYTAQNITSIPADLLDSLICSEENPTVSWELQTNTPGPDTALQPAYPARLNITSKVDSNQGPATNSVTYPNGKACLIVAVWTYQSSSWADLSQWIQPAYNDLLATATNYGGYNQIATLTQNQATCGNIIMWLEYLCITYGSVDLYIYGHGAQWVIIPGVWYYWGYAPWDACNADGSLNVGAMFFPDRLLSYTETNPYDMSTMRMTTMGFCYGWVFEQQSLNPGGNTQHARAFDGGNGDVYADYHEEFIFNWDDCWYQYNYDSSSAHYSADQYAITHTYYGQNQVRYSYADTGTQVWH